MRFRVLGCGWYGAHIASALIADGHEVEIHETAKWIFAGASGANPARLHTGAHYPRSRLTRAACQENHQDFMNVYGDLTRSIPVNIYAVASHDSLVDFENFRQSLRGEIEFITIERPREFGLDNVEGAILTGERHVIIREARKYFEQKLNDNIKFGMPIGIVDDGRWDWTIDCSFCANDSENIQRYEPCLTVLLEGATERAVTIMDGPTFGSIYPWDEDRKLSSLTSAGLTPFSKTCQSWGEAKSILDNLSAREIEDRSKQMLDQIAFFWPEARDRYLIADERLSIRAMPRSGSDARLVDVIRVGERALRVRAGKIDAIFHAERLIREMIGAA